ncbi:MAG: hypothetical protein J6J86_04780 [Lachnospiraceae bacterium]|nr:hypothetical protein [Lachnospiraceae bacterium]
MICMEIRVIPHRGMDLGLILTGILLMMILVKVYESWECKKNMQRLKNSLVPEYNKLLKDREFNRFAFDKDSYIRVRGEIKRLLFRAQIDLEVYVIAIIKRGSVPSLEAEQINDNLKILVAKLEAELPIAEDECKNIFIRRKLFLF